MGRLKIVEGDPIGLSGSVRGEDKLQVVVVVAMAQEVGCPGWCPRGDRLGIIYGNCWKEREGMEERLIKWE